jgi:SNF2 family DNA or RNA helicase
MPFLHASWTGEYLHLWETPVPLSQESPIVPPVTFESIPDALVGILSDQDLISYSVLPFSLSAPEAKISISFSIRLDPSNFVDLVSSYSDEIEAAYTLGPSLQYWVLTVRQLLDFLARGLFFPSVKRRGASLEGVWELYESEEDTRPRLKTLSEKMPGIAMSLVPSLSSGSDLRAVAAATFMKSAVDGVVRSFLKNVQLIEGAEKEDHGYVYARGSVPRKDNIILFWLQSLTETLEPLRVTALEQTLLEQKINDWSKSLRSDSTLHKEYLQLEVLPPEVTHPGEAMELPWSVVIRLVSPQLQNEDDEVGSVDVSDSEKYEFLLLKEIGRIIPVVPFLGQHLERTFSTTVPVTAEEAHQLLVKYQPVLKEIGVVVKAPSWWEESASSVGLVVKLKPKDGEEEDPSVFSSSGLVDFSWTFTIGDMELSLEEFEKLIEEGKSLIYVGDRWISLNPSAIKKNLEQLKISSPQKNFTLFDALRLGLGGLSGLSDIDVVRIDSEGWIQKIIDFQVESKSDTSVPDTFHGELRPYQQVGLAWLSFLSKVGIGGCLADDMGLGKTIQVLALLSREKKEYNGSGRQPNLLIVPMSILGNWESEARKFVPDLDVCVHHGTMRADGNAFRNMVHSADLVITTYSILHRDYKSFRKIPWYRIILDEAQNIKNTDTKQTKAVRSLVEELSKAETISSSPQVTIEGAAVPSDTPYLARGPLRLALTGTPLENRLQELWSIIDFLNPGLLGSLEEFRRRYVNPIEKSKESEAAMHLGKLIKPFVLRRTKTDPEIAAELPEKIEIESLVHLTPEQASLYAVTLEQMLPKVREAEGIHRKGLVLSVITKLKQICVHPALALKDGSPIRGRSGKLQMLEELLETVLSEGDRVLIFTQFAQWGQLLAPYLEEVFGARVPFFHGGLNRVSRDEIVREFQDENGPRMLVLSLKAGGFGLNLTRANQVVHLDQWWNPAIQNQATDRAYRIGQRNNVQVRTLISRGTLEEKINQLHKEKLDLANTIVGTTRNVITELNPDALEELLQLQTNLIMDT